MRERRRGSKLAASLMMAGIATGTSVTVAQPPPPPPEGPAVPAPAPYPTYEPPSYAPAQPAPAPRGYGAPAHRPPPPPARPAPPRVVYGWDPDVPPPDGYELDSDVNMGLIGTGIGLLVTSYVTSILVGVVATQVEEVTPGTESDWSPLYVPVAGPFVALGTLDPGASGVGLLLADGILQSAGVLAIVLGIVDQEYKLIRTGGMEITPSVTPGQQGLVVRGAF